MHPEHLRNRFDCLSMVHSEEFYAQGPALSQATVGGHAYVQGKGGGGGACAVAVCVFSVVGSSLSPA